MTSSTNTSLDFRQIESALSTERTRISVMESEWKHLATKQSITRLEGEINTNHEKMKTHVSDTVGNLEVGMLKQIFGSFVAVLAIVSPIITGILIAILSWVLSNFDLNLILK